MNWNNFKQYLENKILQTEEEPSTLYPEAKSKYAISQEPELITTLTNLITSIDNESSSDYHSLPSLTDLVSEPGQIITWPQLFPNQEAIQFGKKDSEEEISVESYNILGQIFNDWVQSVTRLERLRAALSEDQVMTKFFLEAAISLNYDLIKRKGYDIQLRNWLSEYNQLEKQEKAELTKQKELVDKLLTAFDEESANRQPTKTTHSNGWPSLPWAKVGWYGGGILLIICALGWFRSKLKN